MALLREVDEAARGADDDLDALLERLDLRLVRAAAVDAQHADAAHAAGLLRGRWRPGCRARGSGRRRGPAACPCACRAARRSPRRSGAMRRWSAGMPKPRVLPVPVLAWPMRSVPARASGSVSSWMGKAVMMPSAARASTVAGWTPSSAKVLGSAGAWASTSAGGVRLDAGSWSMRWRSPCRAAAGHRSSRSRRAPGECTVPRVGSVRATPPGTLPHAPRGRGGRRRAGHGWSDGNGRDRKGRLSLPLGAPRPDLCVAARPARRP